MALVSEIKGIQDAFNTLKSEYIVPSVIHRLFQDPKIFKNSKWQKTNKVEWFKIKHFMLFPRPELDDYSCFLNRAAAILFCHTHPCMSAFVGICLCFGGKTQLLVFLQQQQSPIHNSSNILNITKSKRCQRHCPADPAGQFIVFSKETISNRCKQKCVMA